MKTTIGDMWTLSAQVKVIPTNGIFIARDEHVYRAVMGAGVAKQAAVLWPALPLQLGDRLSMYGNRLYIFQVPPILRDRLWCSVVVTFPTKEHFKDDSTLPLIEKSTKELVHAQRENGWENVLLPRVGTGLGGLDWSAVEPLLSLNLDDHFTVVDYPKG